MNRVMNVVSPSFPGSLREVLEYGGLPTGASSFAQAPNTGAGFGSVFLGRGWRFDGSVVELVNVGIVVRFIDDAVV